MELRGRVIGGLREGRMLGYPTANLDCDTALDDGVYAAHVLCGGRRYKAALMVGGDFGSEARRKVEVHLLDFLSGGSLYGSELIVFVYERVSAMVPLECKERLLEKIAQDIQRIREILLCFQE